MANNTYSPSAIFDPGELRAQFIGINIPFVQISYIFLKISGAGPNASAAEI